MDYNAALARIYEHLENDQVEKAVMGCLRLARGLKDYLNAAIFLRELYPSKQEVARALYDDMSHLKQEALKFVWEASLNRWLELHTLDDLVTSSEDDANTPGNRRNVLKIAAGELDAELEQWERAIADITLPSGMNPFDTAAFTDSFIRQKAEIRLRMKAVQTIKARLKTRCLNYAIQIERQIELQHKSQGILEAVQNDVNNYFKVRSDDVYFKLQKASQLATSAETEDAALLLTEVRRALKAAADFFYPPVVGRVKCADGIERTLGDDQYLNRLQEFMADRMAKSAARDLLTTELDHLSSFLRRLNDIASKGVHSSVTTTEAKQGLVGLYFFLFNLSQRMQEKEVSTALGYNR